MKCTIPPNMKSLHVLCTEKARLWVFGGFMFIFLSRDEIRCFFEEMRVESAVGNVQD